MMIRHHKELKEEKQREDQQKIEDVEVIVSEESIIDEVKSGVVNSKEIGLAEVLELGEGLIRLNSDINLLIG